MGIIGIAYARKFPMHPQPQQRFRTTATERAFGLTSAAFADGGTIPKRYTADGEDVSPALTWHGAPPGTASFALVVEDPDAPHGLFTHWLIWNIGAESRRLDEEIPNEPELAGMRQGENGFGRIGWGGPSPPKGPPHRYVFRLYALDAKLPLPRGGQRVLFDRALEGHILGEAKLIATYGR
jgi:Raf kinase inhibitor-like YbhB/YbcL family protein